MTLTNGKIPCGCWCGETIEPFDSRGRAVRFARNHYIAPHLAGAWKRLIGPDDPTDRDCWEWPGSINNNGYGSTKRNGENYVHRAAWIKVNGPIPNGLFVLHKCDNPPCFRPSHLFLGDYVANGQDMAQKGRWRNGGPPPLDEEAVKRAYLSGIPLRRLPKQFSSSMERVRRVIVAGGIEIRKDPAYWKPELSPTCTAGHLFDAENTYISPTIGARSCRKCRAAWHKSNEATLKGAA